MATMIGNASLDERGKISGGKAGDQTGKEVCIRSYYAKWDVVIRLKDKAMREKVADCMEMACKNILIGYDQGNRNSLLNYSRNVGYNPSKVTVPCETDCSSLVTVCCCYAGIREASLVVAGNCATTSTLRKRLQATGAVDVFTGKEYTMSDKKLVRGDILVREGHHTAVVVQTDEAMNIAPKKDIHDVALDVLNGKYSNGGRRRALLIEAGYDPDEVQAEVNRILREKK